MGKKITQQLFTLFLFLALVSRLTSCNGPEKTNLTKHSDRKPEKITDGAPKLIKTQGSGEADNVNSILEDKAGNLWFGTTGEGLYKYDGESFFQYTSTNGLNSNTVHCILEDADGNIWIGTAEGLCLYDGNKFNNIQIPLPPDLPPNKYRDTHNVFDIMQDQNGKLWFATIDGVYVYNGKSFVPFIIDKDGLGFMSSNHNVERMLEDKAGNIWFGGRSNNGVFRYDGKSLTNLKINGDDWASPALVDKNGNIWFNNWNGAYVYDARQADGQGDSFTKQIGLSNGNLSPVTRIIEDKAGTIWFGGGRRGICRFDAHQPDGQGMTFSCLTKKDGLVNEDVWSILEDKSGNLWIGTRNTGLFRYDARQPEGQGKFFTNFSG